MTNRNDRKPTENRSLFSSIESTRSLSRTLFEVGWGGCRASLFVKSDVIPVLERRSNRGARPGKRCTRGLPLLITRARGVYTSVILDDFDGYFNILREWLTASPLGPSSPMGPCKNTNKTKSLVKLTNGSNGAASMVRRSLRLFAANALCIVLFPKNTQTLRWCYACEPPQRFFVKGRRNKCIFCGGKQNRFRLRRKRRRETVAK